MSKSEIKTSYVQIANQDVEIDAYLAQPVGTGKFAAVIVFQEIFGVNKNIREIADLIAQQGYIAIAPAMYQRIAPGFTRQFLIDRTLVIKFINSSTENALAFHSP